MQSTTNECNTDSGISTRSWPLRHLLLQHQQQLLFFGVAVLPGSGSCVATVVAETGLGDARSNFHFLFHSTPIYFHPITLLDYSSLNFLSDHPKITAYIILNGGQGVAGSTEVADYAGMHHWVL